MKEIERVGLLKMDFLGLSTLTLICDAIARDQADDGRRARHRQRAARRREDVSDLPGGPDVRRLPVREQRHARHPAQGEAAAARRPDRAQRALPARAAPQRHGRRLHRAQARAKTEIKYELRCSSRSSRDTYGVIAYQEQVMRIASDLAGFTLGEADLLRKAMGKKSAEVMAKMRSKFVDGRQEARHRTRRRRRRSSTSSSTLPATASTSRTRRRTRCSRTRPRT